MRDEGEVKQLQEMARLGARRCPRCQFIIVKDGGCDFVHCGQCHSDFQWSHAERVVAPVEAFVPAPPTNATHADPTPGAHSTFQGWAQLREAQQQHIIRNNISDVPFDIGRTDSSETDQGVFFYDILLGVWATEPCELDRLAAEAAGKRRIHVPDRDRDELLAFIEVDREHVGGTELRQAIDEASFRGVFAIPLATPELEEGDVEERVWGPEVGGEEWGMDPEGGEEWDTVHEEDDDDQMPAAEVERILRLLFEWP